MRVVVGLSGGVGSTVAALLESGKLDEAEAELNAIAGIVKAQGQSEKSDPFLTNVRKRLAELRREQRKKR